MLVTPFYCKFDSGPIGEPRRQFDVQRIWHIHAGNFLGSAGIFQAEHLGGPPLVFAFHHRGVPDRVAAETRSGNAGEAARPEKADGKDYHDDEQTAYGFRARQRRGLRPWTRKKTASECDASALRFSTSQEMPVCPSSRSLFSNSGSGITNSTTRGSGYAVCSRRFWRITQLRAVLRISRALFLVAHHDQIVLHRKHVRHLVRAQVGDIFVHFVVHNAFQCDVAVFHDDVD